MRKLITGMQTSVDAKIEGPEGFAEWVDTWSDNYDLRSGLVDELRVHIHPLIAGKGKALFATSEQRRALELRSVQQLKGGRVGLIYGIR